MDFRRPDLASLLFVAGALYCLTPWASPPSALVLGLALALGLGRPAPEWARARTKLLLQASVVGLGFGMDLRQVLRVGAHGFAYTALGIAFALLAGRLLARLLKVGEVVGYLVSVGTAICGGSAIAAVGPVAGAGQEEMSAALATVFLLNSVALLLFPPVGAALGLSQSQFGLWAALAIHDTSSVVGACVKYGAGALAVGTTVKLARALWIVPVTLATAMRRHPEKRAKIQHPWFILWFAVAAALATALPAAAPAWTRLYALAKTGLILTLFLIGAGISRATLSKVGLRPLAQGALLWALVGTVSLALVRAGLIR